MDNGQRLIDRLVENEWGTADEYPDYADDLIFWARRQESLARGHDQEVVAANCCDGWPADVGDLDTWCLIAAAAEVAPPTEEWAGDRDLDTYLMRFAFPAAQRDADAMGVEFNQDAARESMLKDDRWKR